MKNVIAIPCFRSEMKWFEKASLIQCGKVFGSRHDIVFFVPEDFDCAPCQKIIPGAQTVRFDKLFFSSVSSYSRLLLSPGFYQAFQKYEYMLVYQLDAWVFRDELDDWCRKDYDYIGAPFVLGSGDDERILVGNGGFSLRRISAFLRVLQSPEKRMFTPVLLRQFFRRNLAAGKYIRAAASLLKMIGILPNSRGRFLERMRHEKYNNEDMVFNFLSRQFTDDGLVMPGVDEAARFSLDSQPERFFEKLPFGCHAWMKNDPSFWKQYIPCLSENEDN